MTTQYYESDRLTDEATQTRLPQSPAAPNPAQNSNAPLPLLQGPEPIAVPTLNLITPHNGADYDYIHHILIGSPQGVLQAINRLHLGHRIERHRWTPLIAVRDQGIHITPNQGQVISYLIQQRPIMPQ